MSDIICAREVLNSKCKVPAESDGEPVEDFDDGDEADSEAKSAKPSEAGDEVKPGHLWGFLKLCRGDVFDNICLIRYFS